MAQKRNDALQVRAEAAAEPRSVREEDEVLFREFREDLLTVAQSLRKTSRALAPSPGPIRPRCSKMSIIRAARV